MFDLSHLFFPVLLSTNAPLLDRSYRPSCQIIESGHRRAGWRPLIKSIWSGQVHNFTVIQEHLGADIHHIFRCLNLTYISWEWYISQFWTIHKHCFWQSGHWDIIWLFDDLSWLINSILITIFNWVFNLQRSSLQVKGILLCFPSIIMSRFLSK